MDSFFFFFYMRMVCRLKKHLQQNKKIKGIIEKIADNKFECAVGTGRRRIHEDEKENRKNIYDFCFFFRFFVCRVQNNHFSFRLWISTPNAHTEVYLIFNLI